MAAFPNRTCILFCATGVKAALGGIASANRNLSTALESVAEDSGRHFQTMTLNERRKNSGQYRAYGGSKFQFSASVLRRLPKCTLVVFDHVHLALPVLALPRRFRAPVVICAHGSESWRKIRSNSIRVFRAADLVLANSNYTLRKMRARFDGFRGVSCPLGLAPQFPMSPAPPPPQEIPIRLQSADGAMRDLGSRVLLLVGRMDAAERQKGHRELLEVLPALVRRFPEAQLVFVGDGSDLAPLRKVAQMSAAVSHVFLAGRLPNDRLEALYRKAYAFVMPSRQEGFGLAYLEAMNYAKPCLACRDDGSAEVVIHEKTGLLIDQPINFNELLDALSRLVADPAVARSYGESGWRRLTEHFSSAAYQKRVAGFLRPLLCEQPEMVSSSTRQASVA